MKNKSYSETIKHYIVEFTKNEIDVIVQILMDYEDKNEGGVENQMPPNEIRNLGIALSEVL